MLFVTRGHFSEQLRWLVLLGFLTLSCLRVDDISLDNIEL